MSDSKNTTDTFPFGQEITWQPNPDWIKESNMQRFMDKHNLANYDALQKRSTEDVAWFWDAVIEDLDIQFEKPYTKVFDDSEGPMFPKWCAGGQMNIIHNCLDKWQDTPARNRVALRWESEEGIVKNYTYQDLNQEVCRCANGLRSLGFGKGDAIGLYMAMTPELAIAFLAIIKIGGVILPLFSGYGPSAIATRLNDAGAKAIFITDGSFRRGKAISMKHNVDQALKSVPTIERVIVQKRTGVDIDWEFNRDIWWDDLVPGQKPTAETESTSAEDTLMIIYTSGTTGKPKGAVHTHCGFPIKGAQDMFHAMDVKPEDTIYWMTDMGWMMGPWLVFGTLTIGASMVFSDGAPDYPNAGRLWEMVEKHHITHLGISPVLIRALQAHGTEYPALYDLSSLRAGLSTGSPWGPESWNWFFENILDSKKPIFNYSGGTEISGGILCGNLFTPQKPCAFSGPVPGMAADVVDENGDSITGAVGELVIRKPWIGMTRGFWNDNQRYVESYWNRFDDVWVHGDFAAIDEDNLWYILGRSDDTIKVAGKRLGPAEAEALLNTNDAVIESAAIGVPDDIKGEALVCFCVLKDDAVPTDELRLDLSKSIMAELGKPLKPKAILFASALPKTRNAKVMRRVIRAAHLGLDTGDVSSLQDPSTLDAIRDAK